MYTQTEIIEMLSLITKKLYRDGDKETSGILEEITFQIEKEFNK